MTKGYMPLEPFKHTAWQRKQREREERQHPRAKRVLHWTDDAMKYWSRDKRGRYWTRSIGDGGVRPGVLTALMGASGAGKTTLMDVLANGVATGVVTGEICINGRLPGIFFQRQVGYIQQHDIHLETLTVRGALHFSACLRQPAHIPKQEKLNHVEEIITLLEMNAYADAVVGIHGEGLNVEQRKRLAIEVELAAKPDLLIFLDELTSGLNSQTAGSILLLLRKLANHGQAILCTVHQPSAMLFQQFDRLLLLGKSGQTVYFGDIGENSRTLIEYSERHGAEHRAADVNTAEWMLYIIEAVPGSVAVRDWPETWKSSSEYAQVRKELDILHLAGEGSY